MRGLGGLRSAGNGVVEIVGGCEVEDANLKLRLLSECGNGYRALSRIALAPFARRQASSSSNIAQLRLTHRHSTALTSLTLPIHNFTYDGERLGTFDRRHRGRRVLRRCMVPVSQRREPNVRTWRAGRMYYIC